MYKCLDRDLYIFLHYILYISAYQNDLHNICKNFKMKSAFRKKLIQNITWRIVSSYKQTGYFILLEDTYVFCVCNINIAFILNAKNPICWNLRLNDTYN